MVNVLKLQTLFSFYSQMKFTIFLHVPEWQTWKALIRLLLKKQSDLGLHCVS